MSIGLLILLIYLIGIILFTIIFGILQIKFPEIWANLVYLLNSEDTGYDEEIVYWSLIIWPFLLFFFILYLFIFIPFHLSKIIMNKIEKSKT